VPDLQSGSVERTLRGVETPYRFETALAVHSAHPRWLIECSASMLSSDRVEILSLRSNDPAD
jgi:hypothetical protein